MALLLPGLGAYGIITGTAIWLLHNGIELGVPLLAAEWEQAIGDKKETLLWVGSSIRLVDLGIPLVMAMTCMVGATFMGIGMVLSRGYPKLLGWLLIVLGAASVVLAAVAALCEKERPEQVPLTAVTS